MNTAPLDDRLKGSRLDVVEGMFPLRVRTTARMLLNGTTDGTACVVKRNGFIASAFRKHGDDALGRAAMFELIEGPGPISFRLRDAVLSLPGRAGAAIRGDESSTGAKATKLAGPQTGAT